MKENSEFVNINIRSDKQIKEDAESVISELGLTLSGAINIFLRTVVRERGIPFELKLNDGKQDTKEE